MCKSTSLVLAIILGATCAFYPRVASAYEAPSLAARPPTPGATTIMKAEARMPLLPEDQYGLPTSRSAAGLPTIPADDGPPGGRGLDPSLRLALFGVLMAALVILPPGKDTSQWR